MVVGWGARCWGVGPGWRRGVGPGRAACAVWVGCGCGRTHVLLPASVPLRRADAVTVIGAGLLAGPGWGHRRVAELVEWPASTVRGWLRRIGAVADRVLAVLVGVAAELGTEFVPPAPAEVALGGPVGAVVDWSGRWPGRRRGGWGAP